MHQLNQVIVTLLMLWEGVISIEIVSLDVPAHIRSGTGTILSCNYDLGKDELYSVKWYKGKDEFYRYVPKDNPPGQVFTLTGINVNHAASNNHQVVLENVTMATSGKYKCEVSAEAPSFQTVFQEQDMIVVEPPEEGPAISGGYSKYQVGSLVNVNCSTVYVSPKASLEWFINDEKVVDEFTHLYPPIFDVNGVEKSVLGLQFIATQRHLEKGKMTLRCVSRWPPLFNVSNERSVNGERKVAPVLESKGGLSQVLINNIATSTSFVNYLLFLITTCVTLALQR